MHFFWHSDDCLRRFLEIWNVYNQVFDSLCTTVHQPTNAYRRLLIPREGKFRDEEWFISATAARAREYKVAEFLTFGVGISSTYAPSPALARSISLFFALSDCPFFSARGIFDLERYERRCLGEEGEGEREEWH